MSTSIHDEALKVSDVASEPRQIVEVQQFNNRGSLEFQDEILSEEKDLETGPSKLQRLSRKTKAILHIGAKDTVEVPDDDKDNKVEDHHNQTMSDLINPTPPASPKFDHIDKDDDGTVKTKISSAAKHVAKGVKHPIDSVSNALSSKAVGPLKKDPYSITNKDIDFVNEASSRSDGENAEKIAELREKQRKLLIQWTTERHIQYVRIIENKHKNPPAWTPRTIRNQDGKAILDQQEYTRWIGEYALYLTQNFTPRYIAPWKEPPPLQTYIMRSQLERVAIGSAPFQEWIMHVRRIYRWDNPKETLRCFIAFLVLWYFHCLVTFGLGYIVYQTLKFRYSPATAEDIRDTINRARNSGETAYRLGELLEKQGKGDFGSLQQEFGPWAQYQLGDVANFLEVIRNFYEWRAPERTACTLAIFSACLIAGFLFSVNFFYQAATFGMGMAYFFCFPIATKYPQYRLLVSPTKWAFYGVPTHAEFACAELRKEAKKQQEDIRLGKPIGSTTVESDDEDDYEMSDEFLKELEERKGLHETQLILQKRTDLELQTLENAQVVSSYNCLHGKHAGKVMVTLHGIRFESRVQHSLQWAYLWRDIEGMKKDSTINLGPVPVDDGRALVIRLVSKEEIKLEYFSRRDKLFNQILGFSGLQWQGII